MRIDKNKFINLFDEKNCNLEDERESFLNKILPNNKYFNFTYSLYSYKDNTNIEYSIKANWLNKYNNFDKKGSLITIRFEENIDTPSKKDIFLESCHSNLEKIDLSIFRKKLQTTQKVIENLEKTIINHPIPSREEIRKVIKDIKSLHKKKISSELKDKEESSIIREFLENISGASFPKELIYFSRYDRLEKITALNPINNYETEWSLGLNDNSIYDYYTFEEGGFKNKPSPTEVINNIKEIVKNNSVLDYHNRCVELEKSLNLKPYLEDFFNKNIELEIQPSYRNKNNLRIELSIDLSHEEIAKIIKNQEKR